MWVPSLAPFLLILLPPIARLANAQSIYSDFPSRSNVLAYSEGPPLNGASNHTKQHEGLEVMAYVTPWNEEGYTLAEAYRGRLASVSPVWYTIKPSGDDVTKYSVLGGPSRSSDVEWYQRLSQPAVDESSGRALPPVKILPRFKFEDWQVHDYKTLLGAAIEGIALTENIMLEVMTKNYDGLVLETGAMWAMKEPIKVLAERLHGEGKELVVIMPALRNEASANQTDTLIRSGVKDLAPLVDKIQIMVGLVGEQARGSVART